MRLQTWRVSSPEKWLDRSVLQFNIRSFRAIGSKIDDGGGGEIDVDVPDPEKIRWILQRGQTMFEANFQCHICNMKFVRQGTMSKHILKHGKWFDEHDQLDVIAFQF